MQLSPSQIAADTYANEAHIDVATADSKLRQRRFFIPGTQFPGTTRQVVRYVLSSPNAYHELINGSDYIIYSGATQSSNSATTPEDVTFHEYGHGLAKRTFSTTGETFDHQIGALHESFSDIAATNVDVGVRGTPALATWKIAEGFWKVGPSHLRSLANPADSHPSASGDWFPWRGMGTGSKWFNSTILSHAYYLSIYGGLHANSAAEHIPEITVPALAFPPATAEGRAYQIFMAAFDDDSMHLAPDFMDLKLAARASALSLFGTAALT
ncbi:MAG: M4 family metallopeptidase [Opitutaceae bacterium]